MSEWDEFFRKVYVTESEYLDQEYLRKKGYVPKFENKNESPSVLAIKSTRFHNLTEGLIDKCPQMKWVALVRNPCAAINSWLSNPLEFPDGADPQVEWRTGKCRKNDLGEFWGFDDWIKVTSLHIKLANQYPERFRLAKYESYVSQLQKEVNELYKWLGLELHKQTLDFIKKSQNTHVEHERAVYKSPVKTQRWRHELDPEIVNAIESELSGTELEQFLY